MRKVGPPLRESVLNRHPFVDVVGPLTPALGLHISTTARPNDQGTMAVYLAEGGNSKRLLGLSCRHVLISSEEVNMPYVRHPSRPRRDVVLLGSRAFTDLADSIECKIRDRRVTIMGLNEEIEDFEGSEGGPDALAVKETQGLVEAAEKAIEALGEFLDQVKKDWRKPDNRILGHILYSPAIALGVGEHRFTEDWGIFQIDRDKLGNGFQGNKMDLGRKLGPGMFTDKCYPRGDDDWEFKYPGRRLLPLRGTITDHLMRNPDMWDSDSEPCLLVVKNGNATGTTIGRANGVFSIVRDYFHDLSINQTSMEWAIFTTIASLKPFRNLAIRARLLLTSVVVSVACLPAVLVRRRHPISPMRRLSGGSSSASRATGSPTRTSASRHLDIEDLFSCDCFFVLYTPLFIGWLLVDEWTGGSVDRCLALDYACSSNAIIVFQMVLLINNITGVYGARCNTP
ncbi:hypothetical protein JAAARDRAFT_522724 [Jaapia argillacea MUCL 33604]|uniref:Uncharacterized protein n=1 Tax=Jaapia argillacea MUCL 33604 TaxID=933084 RepID=A0A067QE55_9AGAM|nr:hypothetical protein JAAARDRAFT_522724 [Jaapia argillacea MUCL 33604]